MKGTAEFFDKQKVLGRPMSPHLTIYKFVLTLQFYSSQVLATCVFSAVTSFHVHLWSTIIRRGHLLSLEFISSILRAVSRTTCKRLVNLRISLAWSFDYHVLVEIM